MQREVLEHDTKQLTEDSWVRVTDHCHTTCWPYAMLDKYASQADYLLDLVTEAELFVDEELLHEGAEKRLAIAIV